MVIVTCKQQSFSVSLPKDSFSRRAVQFENNLRSLFHALGLGEDDVDISQERLVIKNAPASVSWWVGDEHCLFSYDQCSRFVHNLAVVHTVLSHFLRQVLSEELSVQDFVSLFREDVDVASHREAARLFFGLEESFQMQDVNRQYKRLAKELHPDMPTGDGAKFKELNHHHKVLKREFS